MSLYLDALHDRVVSSKVQLHDGVSTLIYAGGLGRQVRLVIRHDYCVLCLFWRAQCCIVVRSAYGVLRTCRCSVVFVYNGHWPRMLNQPDKFAPDNWANSQPTLVHFGGLARRARRASRLGQWIPWT